jgi:lipopolysaccharide biosynthesis glycosyltransferase
MLQTDTNNLDPVVLIFASNERYFPGLYCAVASALAYLKPERKVKVYILDGGLSESSKLKLIQVAQSYGERVYIEFVAINTCTFQEATLGPGNSLMTYSRILIPDLIQEDKAIYLDSDILVLRDLSLLYDWELNADKLMAAVRDFETPTVGDDSKIIAEKLNISLENAYYNCGIILMNIDKLRCFKFVEKSLIFLRDWVGEYRFWDQSAINFLLNGKIQSLPEEWNFPSWKFNDQIDNSLDNIIHFTNSVPWLEVNPGPAQVLFEEYAAKLGIITDKSQQTYRQSQLRHFWQSTIAPIRAICYPILALSYQFLGKKEKASCYIKTGQFWQNYILKTPYYQRLYRQRIPEIRNLKLHSGKITFVP